MTLGARIRARREELRFNQDELAARTGMAQNVISRLERGVTPNPGKDVLVRLARALHCSIDWLVGLYDEIPVATTPPPVRVVEPDALTLVGTTAC